MKHTALALLMVVIGSTASAVEVAPRISDREIIESLAELKAGQKVLESTMNQRFEAVDQRFEAVDRRFETMQQNMDQRFATMERELSWIWNMQLVVIAGIFGLIGFVVWDRKTALKPLEQRLDRLETDLHRDLELQNEEGSRLTRLVKVLREMAKQDEKLAGVLRSFSLM